VDGLDGLKEHSHAFIIFWFHKNDNLRNRKILKVRPKKREDMPLVGVFATRSPVRPNPIGLTLVEIVDVRNNLIIVKNLDAFPGTPILDIKPYIKDIDSAENVRYPKWVHELRDEESV